MDFHITQAFWFMQKAIHVFYSYSYSCSGGWQGGRQARRCHSGEGHRHRQGDESSPDAQGAEDAKLAILTCPFEPPKPKTKHKVDIDTVEKFEALRETEKQYFLDMVKQCKVSSMHLFLPC